MEDQRVFGKNLHKLLASLDMADESNMDQQEDESEAGKDEPDQGQAEAEDADGQDESGQSMDMEQSESSAEDLEEGTTDPSDAPSGEFEDEGDAGDAEEAAESRRPPTHAEASRGFDYKAFTTKNDETIAAEDLCLSLIHI